jgi:hypothetical protein
MICFYFKKKINYFEIVGISSQTFEWSQENIFSHIRYPPLPPLIKKNEIKIKENWIKFEKKESVEIDKEIEEGIWILFVLIKYFDFVCFF